MRRQWSDLSPRTRALLIAGAAVDITLRLAALNDLRRRPAAEVRGSKRVWCVALATVNSAGMLPVVYFWRGRRARVAVD